MIRRRRFWVLSGVLLGFAAVAAVAEQNAALSPPSLEAVRYIAIQHNGRHKPFDSFAREVLHSMTGAPQWSYQDPVETVLSIMADPEQWRDVPLISVPFRPLRESLGMDSAATHVSYNQLVATRKLMRMLPPIVQRQQRDEKLFIVENETMDEFQRFVTLSSLLEQKLELVPPPTGSGGWLSIVQLEGYPADQQERFRSGWTALMGAARRHDAAGVEASAREFVLLMRQANPAAYPAPWRIQLEIFYNRSQPFQVARWVYLLAGLAWLGSLSMRRHELATVALAALGLGYLVHAGGILMRVILGGRPPVSNFFETMLWLPFVAVTLSIILERIYRAQYFGLAASFLAAIVLTLADFVPLDTSITPVVAVLRSNKWLTIHVLTIVASYGALALATTLAHVYGWLYLLRRRRDRATFEAIDLFLYRTLQVGVVLLAGGIMLGAVWANASWGRYWGWDPKETWALITLLWYLAMLHGRFAGWMRGVGFALGTIGGFFPLLMTYYGVSFYLVGLHSYAGGHAKPLPFLLVAYLVAETVFLTVVGLAALRARRVA